MNHQILTAALYLTSVAAQSSISNPQVNIYGCDGLYCTDSNPAQLCSTDGYITGVGIAPSVVQIPGSNTNLSLSLVNGYPQGVFSAPWRYQFTTQKLYIGSSAELDLQAQQPGCALMFQYQAQTFPYLSGLASPNTTQCGDALGSGTLEALAQWAGHFNFDNSSSGGGGGGNGTTSALGVPHCAALAQYLEYRLSQDLGLGPYYESQVSISGGAFMGPDLNTTSDTQKYGSCQPVLPKDYQLHNVLDAQQVLHPDAGYDAGMGGRNGTTPIMTVTYAADGSVSDMQIFCMQQLAPGNRQLPKEQLSYDSAAPRGVVYDNLVVSAVSLVFVVLLLL